MTLEEAEAIYGDEIIRRYFEREQEAKNAVRVANLKKGIEVHKELGRYRRAQIVAMIINGYNKSDVSNYYNISKSTVNKALQRLSSADVLDMREQYPAVFSSVPDERVDMFIKADCNYKKFGELLSKMV